MKDTVVTAIFAGIGALGVARMQPHLAWTVHEVKAREDVYALPPPRELKAMTLGYHAAVVDQLWAKLLVDYGIHWAEHRDFAHVDNYIEAIFALEKDYAPLYHYVSTLLIYRPIRGYEIDARKARAYLEQGTRERPDDWHVWLDYGEYIGYLGPSWLPSEAERQQWRHDGAVAIAHAVELGASPDRSIDVASTLHRFGERDAEIRELRRGYALTDDADRRSQILARLQSLEAAGEREEVEDDLKTIEGEWRASYTFLSRGEFLSIGPTVDPLKCAGPSAAASKECARDWPSRLAK